MALDRAPKRTARIEQTLQRLGLAGEVMTADARQTGQWWDGAPFERILIDAPCSATGVIRRHPDIKLHRAAHDIDKLARNQLALLRALWPLLAPGGCLLYATCSVIPAENSEPINSFLHTHTDATAVDINAQWGLSVPTGAATGRQIFPGEEGMDGFYYALLAKH